MKRRGKVYGKELRETRERKKRGRVKGILRRDGEEGNWEGHGEEGKKGHKGKWKNDEEREDIQER